MRDKSHEEQVERWARFVKENPDKWKIKLKEFLDAQIIMARKFYKNLEEKKGKEFVENLRNKKVL